MFSFFKKQPKSSFPSSIEIEQVPPNDDEIEQEWARSCEAHLREFHGVYASKWKEGDFQWDLEFSAGSLIREEPFVSLLNQCVSEAISQVDGVIESYPEDIEKYVIRGNVDGRELVKNVSEAVDKFMKENLAKWQASLK